MPPQATSVENDNNNFLHSRNDLDHRSIIKSNIIIHRFEKGKIKIQGVTGQTAEINLNKYKLYLNQYTIKEIKNQLD